MTCPKADQLMAGRLTSKANAISSAPASGRERGSDKSPWREARWGSRGRGRGKWAAARRQCQHRCRPGEEDTHPALSRALQAAVRRAWPGVPLRQGQPQPQPLRRIACKLEPDLLRLSKGIVSIFHTSLVIYNSLRVFTWRLGSSDNPPKMKPQAWGRGRGPGWPGSGQVQIFPPLHTYLPCEGVFLTSLGQRGTQAERDREGPWHVPLCNVISFW